MTTRLRLPNEHAKTPAEFAETAIDRGWPERPVRTLTERFREVRYGGREDDAEDTRSAFQRLRQFWGDSG